MGKSISDNPAAVASFGPKRVGVIGEGGGLDFPGKALLTSNWTSGTLGDTVVTGGAIQQRIIELGRELTEDYRGKDLMILGVLRGAILFLADIIRAIDLPLSIDFMAVSSYGSSTKTSGVVRILKDLDEDIKGRNVVLVEDIVDTGLTLNYLLKYLTARSPASLEVCTLLRKRGKQKVPITIKYTGFEIRDEFVVGYGLDHAEIYRNLPYVSILHEESKA